jgi:hypothetical protein
MSVGPPTTGGAAVATPAPKSKVPNNIAAVVAVVIEAFFIVFLLVDGVSTGRSHGCREALQLSVEVFSSR